MQKTYEKLDLVRSDWLHVGVAEVLHFKLSQSVHYLREYNSQCDKRRTTV